jgi:carbamoyl-phosphate synthase large subunit
MDTVTVLITGAGAPGIKGTLYSLRSNFDNRGIRTIGTDIKGEVVGKYLCDEFYQISEPSNIDYLTQLLDICRKEGVDIFLPQNTAELPVLAEHKKDFEEIRTRVAISDKRSIMIANNKYELMKIAQKIDVPTPEFYLVDDFDDLIEHSRKLGWPDKPVVVKPPVSNGMRGFRIIHESLDLKSMFYSEKPTGIFTKMENLKDILGFSFPQLLVMEYLSGEEYTVDILDAEIPVVIPRIRDLVRSGITFNGTVERNEMIIEYSRKLGREIGLKYAYGFQFKMDENNIPKLLESNPRIQGTMVLSTFAGANVIYGAVKNALNEKVPEFDIKWGTKLLRYWGGIGISKDEMMKNI